MGAAHYEYSTAWMIPRSWSRSSSLSISDTAANATGRLGRNTGCDPGLTRSSALNFVHNPGVSLKTSGNRDMIRLEINLLSVGPEIVSNLLQIELIGTSHIPSCSIQSMPRRFKSLIGVTKQVPVIFRWPNSIEHWKSDLISRLCPDAFRTDWLLDWWVGLPIGFQVCSLIIVISEAVSICNLHSVLLIRNVTYFRKLLNRNWLTRVITFEVFDLHFLCLLYSQKPSLCPFLLHLWHVWALNVQSRD